jgi:hypothetical protein
LEFLARAIRHEEEIKGIQIGKGRSQIIPIHRQYDHIPKRSKKLLDTINSFNKVGEYKINLLKSVAFLYINNKQTEKQYRETIPFTIGSKTQISRINLTKDVNGLYKGRNHKKTTEDGRIFCAHGVIKST